MSSFSASSYRIGRSQGRCAVTGRELRPGEAFVVALVEREGEEEMERREYSLEAWEEMMREAGGRVRSVPVGVAAGSAGGLAPGEREGGRGGGEREGGRAPVFASWRAEAADPGRPERMLVDDDSLVDLFEQLEGQTDVKRRAFRFVLALLLVRKRLLILDRAERDRLLVRFKGQDKEAEPTAVEDPGLDEQTLSDVESQLDAILAGVDGGAEGGRHGGKGQEAK